MGVAFEFTEELGDQALFPHVLIKNAEVMVNFGSQVTVLFHQVILFVCLFVFVNPIAFTIIVSMVSPIILNLSISILR